MDNLLNIDKHQSAYLLTKSIRRAKLCLKNQLM